MRSVLRQPGVLSAFLTSGVAMLPMGALGLLLVLQVRDVTGSYAEGGAVAAASAVAFGLANPLLARYADRNGLVRVLRIGGPLCGAAILTQALLPGGAPLALRLAVAVVSGAAQPPVGSFRRRLWNDLVPEPELRHLTYATDGVVMEIVYILGPVAIVGGIGAWSFAAGLAFCAAAVAGGSVLFSRLPAVVAVAGTGATERDLAGALRAPGVLVALGTFITLGVSIGALEVGVPAALEGMGHRELTGLCLGLWGAGSLCGGVVMSRTSAPRRPELALTLLVAAWGALHALVAVAWAPAFVGLFLFTAGATIAPTFTVLNGLLDRIALPGTLTEAFTWTSTGMGVGVALGSALAGTLTDAVSPACALALGGAGLLGALLLLVARATLTVRPPQPVVAA